MPQGIVYVKDVFNAIDDEKQGYKLLDIGCTSGYYSEIINFYFPNTFDYNGCDYNPTSVELAKQYYPNRNFFVDKVKAQMTQNKLCVWVCGNSFF